MPNKVDISGNARLGYTRAPGPVGKPWRIFLIGISWFKMVERLQSWRRRGTWRTDFASPSKENPQIHIEEPRFEGRIGSISTKGQTMIDLTCAQGTPRPLESSPVWQLVITSAQMRMVRRASTTDERLVLASIFLFAPKHIYVDATKTS